MQEIGSSTRVDDEDDDALLDDHVADMQLSRDLSCLFFSFCIVFSLVPSDVIFMKQHIYHSSLWSFYIDL